MSNIRLSEREQQALTAWVGIDEDFGCLPFKSVADLSGLDIRHVRRTVRALARKGLTKYAQGLWTEDGEPAGSGYFITDAGRAQLPKEQT